MRFALDTSLKNIRRKPLRSALMAVLVMFLAFTLFTGAFTIISLRRGLDSYRARLGADIIVVPNSSKGHGTVDDVLLQGITGNYYMSGKDIGKIEEAEGIEAVSRQFFLTSAKASCCSTRVQIIGFDPETDFSVLPWISEEYNGEIQDGDLVVGSKISVPQDRMIRFYGEDYHVACQLSETGTGLDSAVYTNMDTMHRMADDAADLFGSQTFKGVDVDNGASALMIKVREGYEITDVSDDINIHVTKVQATPAMSMIAGIAEGLGSVSKIIGGLVAAIWVLAVVILVTAFALLSNERKKEFAILRVMGASRKMLGEIMSIEAAVISAAGALIGLVIAAISIFPIAGAVGNALDLPMLTPGAGTDVLTAVCTLAVSVLAGCLASYLSARKITGSETGLLLREDA